MTECHDFCCICILRPDQDEYADGRPLATAASMARLLAAALEGRLEQRSEVWGIPSAAAPAGHSLKTQHCP